MSGILQAVISSFTGGPPTNTSLPVISGTAQFGQQLSAISNGSWTGEPTSFARQWRRNGSNISGATLASYVLVEADVGTTITLAVTATNASGSTTAVSNPTATVVAAVPGAPTGVSATATNSTTASVSFTAPSNTGGATITSYQVTSSPGSITVTGGSSPITVTGLTTGTSYTFTVRAANSAGQGPASSASNSAIPNLGITWDTSTQLSTTTWGTTGTNFISGLASSSSVVCAVGYNGRCATSTDGLTWAYRTSLSGLSGWSTSANNSIAWNGSVFCATGYSTSSVIGLCATSPDGITWTNRTGFNTAATAGGVGSVQSTAKLIWNGSVFLTVANVGDSENITSYTLRSSDGITWTRGTIANEFYNVSKRGTQILLFSSGSLTANSQQSTNNGTSFSSIGNVFFTEPTKQCPDNGSIICVGFQNNVRVSTNGTTYTQITVGAAGVDIGNGAVNSSGSTFIFLSSGGGRVTTGNINATVWSQYQNSTLNSFVINPTATTTFGNFVIFGGQNAKIARTN